MAQISISQLPQAAPLTGLELVPIVQNGVTVQTTTGNLISTGGFQTITVNGPISSPSNKGAISYGTLTFSDINIFESFQTSANTYAQTIIQNSNSGSSASVDYVVNNNLSTASTFYGAFGINSSTYSGTGNIRNQPNVVYLESMSGDLAIGTLTANPIHFIVNSGSDAMTVGATGIVSIFGTTPSTSTGTGALVISGGLGVAGTTTSAAIVATENITGALSAGAFSYGTLAYTDINIFESLTTLANNYSQTILQNTSSGTAASVDFIVSNNSGTATTFYGDFGMTSSGYNTPGQNITNSPSTVYLQSASTDLAIGTLNANNLHIMTNSVERATISSVGVISALANIASTTTGTGTLVVTGGVGVSGAINAGSFNGPIGSTTPSTGAFTTLSASSTVTLSPASANVAISPTGTGTVTINPAAASTINNTSIGATVPSTGAFTALTNSATLAQFDSTTKAATTAFTQAVGLKTNARNTVTVTGTLPASYAGSHVIVNSSSSTVQTLPTATSVTAGYQILLTNIGAGSAAVTRNGTDTINFSNGTNGTVLTMFQGDTLFLESNGSNGWDAVDGSVISPYTPSSAESSIGRNVIINGDCSIAQLNGGSLVTPVNGSYPIDNVQFIATQASKLQTQQVANKLNSLGAVFSLTTSVLASYTPLATDQFMNRIPIEGFNNARFQYGTANAKAGSLQIKVTASVAGTYSGAVVNYAGSRSYPFTFTVTTGDSLIQIPNIPGDSIGSWVGATNAGAAYVCIDTGSGTNFKSTANSWQAGNFLGVTGTTNLVSQVNGSTLTISDVQFEVGSVCTQFERKLYGQNFIECQRYLYVSNSITSFAIANVSGYGITYSIPLYFPCFMRASPTVNMTTFSNSGPVAPTATNVSEIGPGQMVFQATLATTGAYTSGTWPAGSTASAQI